MAELPDHRHHREAEGPLLLSFPAPPLFWPEPLLLRCHFLSPTPPPPPKPRPPSPGGSHSCPIQPSQAWPRGTVTPHLSPGQTGPIGQGTGPSGSCLCAPVWGGHETHTAHTGAYILDVVSPSPPTTPGRGPSPTARARRMGVAQRPQPGQVGPRLDYCW